MTQPSMPAPAGAPAHPATCTACGGRLVGPASRCPRCGAVIVGGKAKRSSSVVLIVVLVAAVLLAVPCLGILAAIAIPNFIRYQLRAKQSEVTLHLRTIVQAELSAQAQGGFVPFAPFPAGTPGAQQLALSAEEQALAAQLGWTGEPKSYGTFRITIAGRQDRQVAALCAESDLDGDGVLAEQVAFLAPPGADPASLPPAPCTQPVPFEPRYGLDQVVTVTRPNVF